jgi:cyclopropane-fatty-acyl-phospholipid synthase
MAGSRVGFERDEVELHHVLATRNDDEGRSSFPLRPDW